MCNCGGGGRSRGVSQRGLPSSERSLLPASNETEVWFYAPSIGASLFATNGGVTGRALYFRHNAVSNVPTADADWFVANPSKWVRAKPNDAIIARRGIEYTLYSPLVDGQFNGAANYTFTVGRIQPVLNADLSAVQAAVAGTIM